MGRRALVHAAARRADDRQRSLLPLDLAPADAPPLRAALALVGLGAALSPRGPRGVLALGCALLALVYAPCTISVGGDFMGLHRFIMPLFVAAAIAVTLGLERLTALIPARPLFTARAPAMLGLLGRLFGTRRALASTSVAALLLGAFAVTSSRSPHLPRAPRPDHGIDTPAT